MWASVCPTLLLLLQIEAARAGFHATLKKVAQVDYNDLDSSAGNLTKLHVAGGIVEVFWAAWKMQGVCVWLSIACSRGCRRPPRAFPVAPCSDSKRAHVGGDAAAVAGHLRFRFACVTGGCLLGGSGCSCAPTRMSLCPSTL